MSGERVTYGEFLRWLGLWFLISTVIGPSRESFFSNQTCNDFSEAPFQVSQYMTRHRFDKILRSIRYSKKDTFPQYKDRFWEVRYLLKAWNDNMCAVFSPGWVLCLDESMSPWTASIHVLVTCVYQGSHGPLVTNITPSVAASLVSCMM